MGLSLPIVMITNLLIAGIYPILVYFMGFFDNFDPSSYPYIASTITNVSTYYSNINQVLPAAFILVILAIDIFILASYLALVVTNWLIKKIPFIN